MKMGKALNEGKAVNLQPITGQAPAEPHVYPASALAESAKVEREADAHFVELTEDDLAGIDA